MSRLKLAPIIAVIAVAALVPASAAAKGAPLYSVSVKGSQVSTWTYGHVANGFCDATIDAGGSQIVRYATPKLKLALHKVKGHEPYFAAVNDLGAKYGAPMPIAASVTAEREATDKRFTPDGVKCGGAGGGGTSTPDCGERFGRLDLHFGYDSSTRDNHLRLGGHYTDFLVGTLPLFTPKPGTGETLGHTFNDCGFWAPSTVPSSPSTDKLLEAEKKFPVKKLLALKKGKTAKVSADFKVTYDKALTGPERGGDTAATWNATIKRLK